KTSPGALERLSIDTPLIGPHGSPRNSPAVAATTSSTVHRSLSATIDLAPDRGADGIVVAKRYGRLADRLAAFVAFAGHQQNVALRQRLDGHADGACPVAGIDSVRAAGKHLGADAARILAPRIVVRHIGDIGKLRGHGAHLRPLAPVAIAAR